MNYKLQTGGGDMFQTVAEKAKRIATSRNCTVEFDFNGILCLVDKETHLDSLYRDYQNAHIMEWKTGGAQCKMWYDADTEIELYTRKLKAATERKKEEEK